MRPAKMIKTFTDRYPLIGPSFWMLSLQYFVTQLVVAHAWTNHYSWAQNTISDLGNSACGTYGDRFVCSPLHDWMNASFILLGLSMIIGAVLIYQEFRESRGSAVGFSCMALAGFGTLLVGLFPENTVSSLHVIGAALPFLIGNLGMVVLGSVLALPRSLRIYTILSGGIALLALLLFIMNTYLGLGLGGMERLTAYPQTLWLIAFGIYMSGNHVRRRHQIK
jgi:hypothetical membrane protein